MLAVIISVSCGHWGDFFVQILRPELLRNATDILLALLASKMRALVRLLKEQERGGKDGGADSNTDKDPDDE